MIQDRVSSRWGIGVQKSEIRRAIKQANQQANYISREVRDGIGRRLAELISRQKATEPNHSVKKNEQF